MTGTEMIKHQEIENMKNDMFVFEHNVKVPSV